MPVVFQRRLFDKPLDEHGLVNVVAVVDVAVGVTKYQTVLISSAKI